MSSEHRINTCVVCGIEFKRIKVTLCCSPECRHELTMVRRERNNPPKARKPRKKKKQELPVTESQKMFECPFSSGALGDEIGDMNCL